MIRQTNKSGRREIRGKNWWKSGWSQETRINLKEKEGQRFCNFRAGKYFFENHSEVFVRKHNLTSKLNQNVWKFLPNNFNDVMVGAHCEYVIASLQM